MSGRQTETSSVAAGGAAGSRPSVAGVGLMRRLLAAYRRPFPVTGSAENGETTPRPIANQRGITRVPRSPRCWTVVPVYTRSDGTVTRRARR